MTDRSMHLLYVHSTALGYARYGVKLADALTRYQNVTINDHLTAETSSPDHLACWVSTPVHASGWFDKQRSVISTMWETQQIPEAFREGLHNFDQVLVPSDQNVELFSRYHDNVVKVPLGIDSEEWRYRQRRSPTTEFKFLIGGSGSRKGQDLAYKAFRKVFKTWPSDMPEPILQFKSPRPVDDFLGDRIEVIGGRVSDEKERDLYAQAHCYLQPSRGEGFGLQPLQAIAQGLPTILTDAHGHSEFAYLGYGISAKSSPADYFIYGDAGNWWEPSLDELCSAMEWVYYHYDEAVQHAVQASKEAHARFTWKNTAKRFVEAVGEEHFVSRYTGTCTWVAPELKKFLVTVLKPWQAEVNDEVHQWLPGIEYWEVADIKRMMWEAGVLDPSCVVRNPDGQMTEAETGLAESQLKNIDSYSAKHSYCWTCGQKLNSGEKYEPVF